MSSSARKKAVKAPEKGAIKKFFINEIKGWKKLELCWLAVATAVILGLSIYWKENFIGIVSALTGVWCVIFTGKGKRSSFIFGTINVLFYAIVSLKAKYYGEVMLNLLYYLPMNFVGWFMWKKHMNEETGEVKKTHLSLKKGTVLYALTAVAILLYGTVLRFIGGKLPYIDSMSTTVSVTAQILSVKRLTEQWVLWIIVDVVTVIMWGINFAKGGENIATLAMWSVYLINAIIMFIKWNKEAKKS